MTLLARHLNYYFWRYFSLAIGAFSSIYLLIEFFERIDNLLEHQASWALGAAYFLSKIPLILGQLTPLAVLLATFMTLGTLARQEELTAMRACGISLSRISWPLLQQGLLITGILLILGETLLPATVRFHENIWQRATAEGTAAAGLQLENTWLRHGNSMVYIRLAEPQKKRLHGISIFQLNENMALKKRLEARRAVWQHDHWQLQQVVSFHFTATGKLESQQSLPAQPWQLNKKPADFQQVETSAEHNSAHELYKRSRRLAREGYPTSRLRVDMHAHLARPCACLIMVLLGIPFALQSGRQSHVGLGLALTIGIGLAYFVLHTLLLSFGYSGLLPPVWAAWSSNLLFLLLAAWLLLQQRT